MKRKGFTLIELLAVIVILAIIALIATPLVLKYIEKSRSESKVDSAYSYVRNLETEITNYSIKNKGSKYNIIPANNDFFVENDFTDSKINTTVKGDNPEVVKVCLSSLGQVEKAMLKYGNYYISYNGKKGNISDESIYNNFTCSNIVYENELSLTYMQSSGDFNYYALDKCIDLNLFETAKMYNVTMVSQNDGSVSSYDLTFMSSLTDGQQGFSLANSDENMIYGDVSGVCMFLTHEISYDTSAKYNIKIKELKDVYPFSLMVESNRMHLMSTEFINGPITIKIMDDSGYTVEFETEITGTYTPTIKRIYDTQYDAEHILQLLNDKKTFTMIVTVDDKEYKIGGTEFKLIYEGNPLYDGCRSSAYYYWGDNMIDYFFGC